MVRRALTLANGGAIYCYCTKWVDTHRAQQESGAYCVGCLAAPWARPVPLLFSPIHKGRHRLHTQRPHPHTHALKARRRAIGPIWTWTTQPAAAKRPMPHPTGPGQGKIRFLMVSARCKGRPVARPAHVMDVTMT
jgi:hypothetical protein